MYPGIEVINLKKPECYVVSALLFQVTSKWAQGATGDIRGCVFFLLSLGARGNVNYFISYLKFELPVGHLGSR